MAARLAALLAPLLLLSSCTNNIRSIRMQPVAVISEPEGATAWIEEKGERREVGVAPAQVEVAWQIIERRFPTWTVWIPITGAALFGGGLLLQEAGQLDHDRNYAFTVISILGALAAVVSAPFIIVGWLQDGSIVSERPVPGTRIGVSLAGHEDDARSLDNERYAQSTMFVLHPTPLTVIEQPSSNKPVEPASTPRRDLPEELRPDQYRPTPD